MPNTQESREQDWIANQWIYLLNSFAYVQQVSLILEGTTQKSVLWYKFYIGNYRENLQVKRE